MDLVLLHHLLLHHKSLLLDLCHSNPSRTVDRLRTCGKHHLKTGLQQHLRSRQFRLRLQSNRFRLLPKHSSQHHRPLLPERPEHLKMHLRLLLANLSLIEHLLYRKPEFHLRRSLQLLMDHGLYGQMTEHPDSLLQQQLLKDVDCPVLSSQK